MLRELIKLKKIIVSNSTSRGSAINKNIWLDKKILIDKYHALDLKLDNLDRITINENLTQLERKNKEILSFFVTSILSFF
jgi:hypothetical protein